MKEPKLTYRLKKLTEGLEFQVLQMREEYRGGANFQAKNGFWIHSKNLPDLAPITHIIFLRGRIKKDDLETTYIRYLHVEERDKYYDQINEALKEWAEHWGGGK